MNQRMKRYIEFVVVVLALAAAAIVSGLMLARVMTLP